MKGTQYVTVLTGMGTSATLLGPYMPKRFDYRTQVRRVLTFALNGKASLPQALANVQEFPDDPAFRVDAVSAARGEGEFALRCIMCHGFNAVSGGGAPDLRRSSVPLSADAFAQIVREGALVPAGMPAWPEFTDQQLSDIREYLRTEAHRARTNASGRK